MGLTRREEKIKQAITDALTSLCKDSLSYELQFSIEGLLGITLDETDVILVKIDETVGVQNQSNKNPEDVIQVSDNVPSAKRGRPMKGRTRGRGRGRTPAAIRKQTPTVEPATEKPHPASSVQVTRRKKVFMVLIGINTLGLNQNCRLLNVYDS